LLESKESSASQLRRDPANVHDISPAHLATGCGKPDRLLLYRGEPNAIRPHGLDKPRFRRRSLRRLPAGHPGRGPLLRGYPSVKGGWEEIVASAVLVQKVDR